MTRRRRWLVRLLVWPLLICLVSITAVYIHATSPARLRGLIARRLAQSPVDVHIGAVSFALSGVLSVEDLEIPLLRQGAITGKIAVKQARFTAPLSEWLSSVPALRAIELHGVVVALIPASSAGADVPKDFGNSSDRTDTINWLKSRSLPTLLVDDGEIEIRDLPGSISGRGKRWRFAATGAESSSGYLVRVFSPRAPEALGLDVRIDRTENLVSLRAASIELNDLAPLLGTWVEVDDAGALSSGVLQIHTLQIPLQNKPDALLGAPRVSANLRNWSVVLPIEQTQDADPTRTRRFLRFNDLNIDLDIGPDDDARGGFHISGQGRINDSPAAITIAARAALAQTLLKRIFGEVTADPATMLDSAELSVGNFDLPYADRDAAFIESPQLPGAIRDALHRYQPRGRVDALVRINPPDQNAPGHSDIEKRLEVAVDARGGSVRYERFPYEFHDVRGRVHVLGGRIFLEHLTGVHGTATVVGSGVLDSWQEWTGFQLDFRGRNLALSQDLFESLDDEDRGLWREARPSGVCDLDLLLSRPSGTSDLDIPKADIRITARLFGGSVSLEEHRLTDASGTLRIQRGRIDVEDLHGFEGPTAMRVSGRIHTRGDRRADLRVEVAGMPVARTGAELAAGTASKSPGIQFDGNVDVWGRVTRILGETTGEKSPTDSSHYAARVRDGVLHSYDEARTWQTSDGWVTVAGPKQDVHGFYAQQGSALLAVRGDPDAASAVEPARLEVVTVTPQIEETLPQLVPSDWRDLTALLGLSGAGEVHMQIDNTGGGEGTTQIGVEAENCRFRPLPLPVRNVSASVSMRGDTLEFRDGHAQLGQTGVIALHGHRTHRGDDLSTRIHADAQRIDMTDELVNALPDDLAAVLRKLQLRGSMNLKLDWSSDQQQSEESLEINGDVALCDARMWLGLELDRFEGDLIGTYRTTPDGRTSFDGDFHLRRGRLAGREIENVEGVLHYPVDGRFVGAELRGQIGTGSIVANLRVDPHTNDYELRDVRLEAVPLVRLLPPAENGAPPKPRPGTVSGSFSLGGRSGVESSRSGTGAFRIIGGGFMNAADTGGQARSAPDPGEVAEIWFTIDQLNLILRRVELRGSEAKLVGENGRVNLFNDQLELELSVMLAGADRPTNDDAFRYELRGPWFEPKANGKPLFSNPFRVPAGGH